MVNPCDNCIVDLVCILPCIDFRRYIHDRLIGLHYIPKELVSSEVRFKRSIISCGNFTWMISHLYKAYFDGKK